MTNKWIFTFSIVLIILEAILSPIYKYFVTFVKEPALIKIAMTAVIFLLLSLPVLIIVSYLVIFKYFLEKDRHHLMLALLAIVAAILFTENLVFVEIFYLIKGLSSNPTPFMYLLPVSRFWIITTPFFILFSLVSYLYLKFKNPFYKKATAALGALGIILFILSYYYVPLPLNL